MNHRRQIFIAWLPALSYMALIWVLSSMSHLPSFGDVPFQDKGVHFMEYATLATLLAHALRGTWSKWQLRSVAALAITLSVCWGLSDEIHQAFVPGRSSDAKDLLADALGSTLGVTLYVCALLLIRRVRGNRRDAAGS